MGAVLGKSIFSADNQGDEYRCLLFKKKNKIDYIFEKIVHPDKRHLG